MRNKWDKPHGFTLIEILVVVLIISISLGFALLAMGDFGEQRRLFTSAEQFVNYVTFAEHQAIIESNTLGVRIMKSSYYLLRFQPPSHWLPMPNKSMYRIQHFPKHTITSIESETGSNDAPQIIVDAEGDITPFILHLKLKGDHVTLRVVGSSDGKIKVLSTP
ncbi:MAG: type II secretion system minor pseudopilin GspH [Legionellales bacterium]|nr:type II secretion system minor pseudopilin GspH [Legionellales bacterium]